MPRKLGIMLEFDFTSDENRRIHKSKAQQVADEAIQAASKVVQDGLLDEAISAAVRTRIQWGYAWVDQEAKSTLKFSDEPDDE